MRIAATLICAAITATSAHSQSLSSADREALLDSLEALRASAESKIDGRFRTAISAYRSAMGSNEAAIEFYLKCIEKVNYQDKERKATDFREWKRNQSDQLSDAGFRLALRYQLRWLTLTLRASSEKPDMVATAIEAQEIVDAIFKEADTLIPFEQVLSQPVTSTVFATAYEINGLQKNDWPASPILLEQIYEKVIFPPLRTPARLETLRSSWIKRIQQEALKTEFSAGRANGKGGKGGKNTAPDATARTLATEKFTTETLPQLQWDMEMDLFRSGDEAGAAKRMLTHITKYITHKDSRKWGDEFKKLLKPEAPPVPVVTENLPSSD